MSLSSFVCSCVRSHFFSLEHSKQLKQDVLRELQGCLRGVCLKFQGCLEVFQETLKVLTEGVLS